MRASLLPLVLVLVSAAACTGAARADAGPPGWVDRHVTRVVDGDTFVLSGKQRVRLAGVNCPEIDEPLGLEARAFAMQFALRRDVRIDESRSDRYGRLVSDVRVDGKSLSEAIVDAGLGHVFLIPPVDAAAAGPLLAAQDRARAAGRGVWATDRYRGDLHITSFHANPIGDDTQDLNAEYVRIANLRTAPVSLKGWILSNEHGDRYVFRDVTVPAGQSVTLASGSGDDEVKEGAQIRLFWNRTRPTWSNKGDAATLMDPAGNVVDRVEYDPAHRKVYPK